MDENVKLVCTCGSTKIKTVDAFKRTNAPKDMQYQPKKRASYGYRFKKHVCECGNSWEGEKIN